MGPSQHPRYTSAAKTGRCLTSDYKPPTRLKHLLCSGAGLLKPQIYEAATELGDNIRYVDRPETETLESHRDQEIQQEIPQENSEKHTDDMVKVITPERVSERIRKQVVPLPKILESRRVQRIQSRHSDGRRGVRLRVTVSKSSASMTYEGQAGAAKEQSMSESRSRAFRADTSHQDPQLSFSSQISPYLRFDPAQS